MDWLGWTALGIGLLLAAAARLVFFGRSRWAGAAQSQVALLEAACVPQPARRYDACEIDTLPAPVQRYLRAVLNDGQPAVAAASFELAGTINPAAVSSAEQWKVFTSTQRAATHRPGFLWNGRVAMLPGLAGQVHDSYIAGVGTLHAALLGVFTIARVHGGREAARGELIRYFWSGSCSRHRPRCWRMPARRRGQGSTPCSTTFFR